MLDTAKANPPLPPELKELAELVGRALAERWIEMKKAEFLAQEKKTSAKHWAEEKKAELRRREKKHGKA
jgi:hypothetical protein